MSFLVALTRHNVVSLLFIYVCRYIINFAKKEYYVPCGTRDAYEGRINR